MSFTELTCMILNPNVRAGNIWIGDYAKLWDEAILAQVQYQLDQTDATWAVFKTKMEAARKLPPL